MNICYKIIFFIYFLSGIAMASERAIKFDFEETPEGKLPEQWFIPGTFFKGNWKVVKDDSAPNGSQVLAQTAQNWGVIFNLCIVKSLKFRNLSVSTSFKAIKGKTDQGGGIIWRYQNKNNYYVARFNPLEKNFTLYKVNHGFRSVLTSREKIPLQRGHVWHTMKIKMKGSRIIGFLDGKKYWEFNDETFPQSGKVGLWTKSDAQTYFDNFLVKKW